MNILKLVALFLTIWTTIINTSKIFYGHAVPGGNFILQAAGITAFVYLQWLV